jgi:cytochrome bd-type quinol oxidase subunit 2
LGRFDHSTDSAYSLFWMSVSVLAFRVLVTLIAPIWIVRSASERAQKRAGTIALPIALGILVLAHAGFLYASIAAYGENLEMLDYFLYFSPELLILAGIALAITLYRSVDPTQLIPGPVQAPLETTGD